MILDEDGVRRLLRMRDLIPAMSPIRIAFRPATTGLSAVSSPRPPCRRRGRD
jgi:hypothetical protein